MRTRPNITNRMVKTKYLKINISLYFFFSNRYIIAAPYSPSIEIIFRLFAVSHDAKFIFSDYFFHLPFHVIVIQMKLDCKGAKHYFVLIISKLEKERMVPNFCCSFRFNYLEYWNNSKNEGEVANSVVIRRYIHLKFSRVANVGIIGIPRT